MIVSKELCKVCGNSTTFITDDNVTLLREAVCSHCGASIRNSDVAGEILDFIDGNYNSLEEAKAELENYEILNTCSTGTIYEKLKMLEHCTNGEYIEGIESGTYKNGIMCVDLTNIPFGDNTLDIVISEDVMEHVEKWNQAFREIFRVLKPGGLHIFSVPVHEQKNTISRNGLRPVYHGNPNPERDSDGSLVYTDWGKDIKNIVDEFGFKTMIKRCHKFYSADQITDVDLSYQKYLEYKDNLQKYMKYNSNVIVAEKPCKRGEVYHKGLIPYTNFDKQIRHLNKVIAEQNERYRLLDDDNVNRGKHNLELDKQIDELNCSLNENKEEIRILKEDSANLTKTYEDKLEKYKKDNESLEQSISRLNQEIKNKEGHIQILLETEREYERVKASFDKQIRHLNKVIAEQNERYHLFDDDNINRGKHNLELDKQIDELNYSLNEIIEEIRILKEDSTKLTKTYEDKLEKYKKDNESLEQLISRLNQETKNKEGHIQILLETEREYERVKASRGYRVGRIFTNISHAIFPLNSKRRFVVKLLLKFLKNPSGMLHSISKDRIKKFFRYYKEEGIAGINKRVNSLEKRGLLDETSVEVKPFEISNVDMSWQAGNIDEIEKIHIPYVNCPIVSIIIPVYNQFNYTYLCIKSIVQNSGDIKYEIIIADDCSTDLTTKIESIIEGLTIAKTKSNMRFLRNCNNAAKFARGKYLLFLNNDTQVQKNWLSPMVQLLENDNHIGMTGSKLVYPDGYLQEAGGIVWNDASAWNYGNRKNPDDPEFNYVKEVDYISGASIMIRHSLWNEIGGFDERFAPAYYEDTDLAFEVRKHGYSVVYQPLSVVVHFEGISNGKDVSEGVKKYQEINFKKFYDKWRETIQKNQFANGENVYLAKDRGQLKKQVLIVDHYVPHYDQDAGGRCTYMYLQLFVKLGYKVTFIGDNFFKHEPYTTILNQQGIEVLYGNYYYNNWQQWLKDNLHYFDVVYLQRPHIAIKYIDLVKKYGKAKIFYFAHDLHHIREQREYKITGDLSKLESSKYWKKIEYELFEKADVGHVVGSFEQKIMQDAFPDKPIRNIPLYIYENKLTDINKDFKTRKDLIYVGGFGHPPNIDAVLWFGKTIMPKIVEKYPEIVWHVIGNKVTDEIQALNGKNIIIEGFIPDDKLETLYRTCRIAVVPLRYGAGVKGKVVEAAYYQIPLITTSIGAEGLDSNIGNMLIEDDADQMATRICNLYSNYDELSQMSNAGLEFIGKYFTSDVAKAVLEQDL